MSATITASMVLYENQPEIFGAAIQAFLDCDPHARIAVVDNSARPLTHDLFRHARVAHIFAGKNLGFGAGHNLAFRTLADGDFHLLLNPDVRFSAAAIQDLLSFMAQDARIGAAMPRICFPDGSLQRLCKLLPTPLDLLLRRFVPFSMLRESRRGKYELDGLPQDRVSDVPSLSGCFLLLRADVFRDLRGFDERYFMYMEDVDLIRRIGDHARTVYYPFVSIEHQYAKGSYNDMRLLRYHVRSAVKYFAKWGWCFDEVRRHRNASALRSLRSTEGRGSS
ncbi:MAG: glycosyltransferase family 2 protein [Terriglobales bacterium]